MTIGGTATISTLLRSFKIAREHGRYAFPLGRLASADFC